MKFSPFIIIICVIRDDREETRSEGTRLTELCF